jgi:dGTPase
LNAGAIDENDPAATRREYPIPNDGYRTEFERDYTRILHSRSFRRLRHKTQVFISPHNDHICTRLEHSLCVASIAKTIAKKLGFNEDLVSAIAIGHDLGHSPFGHAGERKLNEIAGQRGFGFQHEIHGLRVVDVLESPYTEHAGLNLTFAVRDGIACHNGEAIERELTPNLGKGFDELGGMTEKGPPPFTYEACVVRFADKIAYLGRDLEDGITAKIINEADVPPVVRDGLGTTNKQIINKLIRDLVEYSDGKATIGLSATAFEAFKACYDFNMEAIYRNRKVASRFRQVASAMARMVEIFEAKIDEWQRGGINVTMNNGDPQCMPILADFLTADIRNWQAQNPARLAVDFVAGMTDSFFIETFSELFMPYSTV